MRSMTYLPRRAKILHPPNTFRRHLKNRLGILRSMIAHTPPPSASIHCSHLIPREILKGFKFKQRSRDRHHTRFEGNFNPGVALAAHSEILKACSAWLYPKNDQVTKTTPLSGINFLPLGGTCRSRSTCQI